MSMTYNSLRAQIISYLDRTDAPFVAQIPNFISQAEQRIARESKCIGLEQYINGTMLAANNKLSKPARWRRTLSFYIQIPPNTSSQLFLRGYDFIRTYWPDDTVKAQPLYYSDYGYDVWLIGPTPDIDYNFEISYLELPSELTELNQTNWTTDNAPDLLLYASLLETAPYLKTDERIQVWQGYYDKALASINAQDDMRTLDRASNRSAD